MFLIQPMETSGQKNKILMLRLSSLGDVILAASALESLPRGVQADWVTSTEYSEIFEGHPRVGRVIAFNRKAGLGAWLKLAARLNKARYTHFYDLHSTLRSHILSGALTHTRVRRIKKPRLKWRLLFRSKSHYPRGRAWRIPTQLEMYAAAMGSMKTGRPDFSHLIEDPLPGGFSAADYYCVMPGSLWPGKRWPVESFLEVIRNLRGVPVILGADSDADSVRLVALLQAQGIPHVSGVGRWRLRQTARVLSSARFYLGGDTGLAHLAEAVGCRTYVLFGPTSPELGFGPWRPESLALQASLDCRPCSKDGSACFRKGSDEYLCLKKLTPDRVVREVRARD